MGSRNITVQRRGAARRARRIEGNPAIAVETLILSGSHQGRCFRFDGDRILAGDVAVANLVASKIRELIRDLERADFASRGGRGNAAKPWLRRRMGPRRPSAADPIAPFADAEQVARLVAAAGLDDLMSLQSRDLRPAGLVLVDPTHLAAVVSLDPLPDRFPILHARGFSRTRPASISGCDQWMLIENNIEDGVSFFPMDALYRCGCSQAPRSARELKSSRASPSCSRRSADRLSICSSATGSRSPSRLRS